MKNYTPRSLKISQPTSNKLIKLLLLIILFLLVLILTLFTDTRKENFRLNDEVFQENYTKNKRFIKIDKLKFIGYNNDGKPFLLTANQAIKETRDEDKVILYKVKADINLSDKSWFFLETEKATYRIKEKTLYANNEVIGFYDDGSSFTTPSLEYNFKSGIAESEEGIVMFGKWGIIEADKFSFNSIKDTYKFDDRALMIVK